MHRAFIALFLFAQMIPSGLVDIKTIAPTVAVDLKYASADNVLGVSFMSDNRCYLVPSLAKQLAHAETIVSRQGFHLVLWDCYRSEEVQRQLWNACVGMHGESRCRGLVGNPDVALSYHNSGEAVDIALVDEAGILVEMPSKFDSGLFPNDSGEDKRRARRPAQQSLAKPELWSEAGWKHFQVLEIALLEAGLSGISSEWWHWSVPRSAFSK